MTAPVGVADGALPLGRWHAHAAAVADAVAAAVAHGARVPQLAQRPLAAGAGALAVLPGDALGASPPQILELQLHPPEVKWARGKCWYPACKSKLLPVLYFLGGISTAHSHQHIGKKRQYKFGGVGTVAGCIVFRQISRSKIPNVLHRQFSYGSDVHDFNTRQASKARFTPPMPKSNARQR